MNIFLTPLQIVVQKNNYTLKTTHISDPDLKCLNFLHHHSLIMYPERDD